MGTPQDDWAAPDDRGGRRPPSGQATGQPTEQPTSQPAPGPPPQPAPWTGQQPAWQAPPGWGGPQQAPSHGPPPGWQGPPPGGPGWGWSAPPEVKPGVVPLRPLGLGELLDGAVGVVRRYPRPTIGLSALIALVTTLVNVPVLVQYYDSALFSVGPTGSSSSIDVLDELGSLAPGFVASTLLSQLAAVVLAGVITAVVGKAVLGQPMSFTQAWTAVRPLLLRLVVLAFAVQLLVAGLFLGSLAVMVGLSVAAGPVLLLVGVPLFVAGTVVAVHVYVRLALAPSVMVLERASIRESLRRSGVLVKGDWWRIFGILLLVMVITTFVAGVLQGPFEARSFIAGFRGETPENGPIDVVLRSIGQALALTVVSPFAAAVSALLYVDRRMRAEGLDVALTAAATRTT